MATNAQAKAYCEEIMRLRGENELLKAAIGKLAADLHARELAGYRDRESEILHLRQLLDVRDENERLKAQLDKEVARNCHAQAEIERLKEKDA